MQHQYGLCMYEKPLALFLCVFFIVIIVIIWYRLVSAVMPVGSLVLSVGSVEFPASSLVWDEMC